MWLLGGLAVFRRSPWPAGIAFIVGLAVWIFIDLSQRWGLDESFFLLFKLAPYFLGGAFIFFIVERYGINPWLAIFAICATAVLIVLVPRWGGQAAAPLLAYALLWLSSIVRQPGWIAKNDVSYGFYIYAWPVQQLVILVAGASLAFPVYLVATVVLTFALAWLSWVAVERRAMRWVRPASTAQTLSGPPAGVRSP